MNLPNKLTLGRMIAVPFFIAAFMMQYYLAAFIIFVLASVTDWLDGYLARKWNMVSNFGKIMDPLADKILVYSAFCLMVPDQVPGWMLIIILAREFVVSGMRTVAASEGIVIAAGKSGKVKTASSMVGLCLMMALPGIAWLNWLVIGVIVITTVYSGVEYFIQNWNCLWDY